MISFNEKQLAAVCGCAEKCDQAEWPNELAVYDMVREHHAELLGPQPLKIVAFCAEETAHQKAGALAVFSLVKAWNFALERKRSGVRLDEQLLGEIASLIEPVKNRNGRYRCMPVTIGGRLTGTAPEFIAADMREFDAKLSAYQDGEREWSWGQPMSAHSLYVDFERIHPRNDGNGREGKVIYNWLIGTLDAPEFPAEPEWPR